MPPRTANFTFLPFLYPSLFVRSARPSFFGRLNSSSSSSNSSNSSTGSTTTTNTNTTTTNTSEPSEPLPAPSTSPAPAPAPAPAEAGPATQESADAELATAYNEHQYSIPTSRLNPSPDDYSAPTFTDKALLTLHAGRGGHGCISFHREAYRPDGPPDGGDGGSGGSIYIQAVHGETSLHKLARRRVVRAGRGTNGKGGIRTGTRGGDVVLLVPVGTVIRETERTDPVKEEDERRKQVRDTCRRKKKDKRLAVERGEMSEEAMAIVDEEEAAALAAQEKFDELDQSRFLIYPGISKSEAKHTTLPRMPHLPRLVQQPPGPIAMDLSYATKRPILLAAGGSGGLGNPHFISRETPRPLCATRGTDAVTLSLELELKLLADIGLVGLPNAGKSTLLRGLSNSRARVGSWAFTTLRPNIGTVVLDNNAGRPFVESFVKKRIGEDDDVDDDYGSSMIGDMVLERRTRFTVADIPGLIEDAHQNKGLGIEFLRHVERARVLAFVLDLGAGDAVQALDSLWREVGMYARMRDDEERNRARDDPEGWFDNPTGIVSMLPQEPGVMDTIGINIAAKPWFVVANKGDLPETEQNFGKLKEYLDRVTAKERPHPSGLEGGWVERCQAIPVSAIHGHGIDRVVRWMVDLLDGQ